MLVATFGSPNVKAERLVAYEVGYRLEPNRGLSLDIAAYYNVYHDLIDTVTGPVRFEPAPAPAHLLMPETFANVGNGHGWGTEISAQWQATARWRLAADYTWLRIPVLDGAGEFDSPEHQVRLRSYLTLARDWEINTAIQYTSRLVNRQFPAAVRADVGFVWRPLRSLELGVWGQNLLDPAHPEAASFISTFRGQVPRTFLGKLTWRY
jgi:iron complex outermembrane receptor protein